jgi:glutaredoxin-related protein
LGNLSGGRRRDNRFFANSRKEEYLGIPQALENASQFVK